MSRLEGFLLVGAYIVFVAVIWRLERRPPTLGETAELEEAVEAENESRVGIELVLVLAGVPRWPSELSRSSKASDASVTWSQRRQFSD